MIRKIDIAIGQIKEAEDHFDFGELKNSKTKGKGNFIGALGEIVIRDQYNGKLENTYDYDLIIKEKKIEVKTKLYSVGYKPQEAWNISVEAHNDRQKCDIYCFTLIPANYAVMYLCGWITKERFYKDAKKYNEGDLVPIQDGSGRTWKASCPIWALPISQLD